MDEEPEASALGQAVSGTELTHTKDGSGKPPGSLRASPVPVVFPLPGVCTDPARQHLKILIGTQEVVRAPNRRVRLGVGMAQGWGLLALPPFQSR